MRSKPYKEKAAPSDGDAIAIAKLEARVKALEAALAKQKPRHGDYSVDELSLDLESAKGASAASPVLVCDEYATIYYIISPPYYSEENKAVIIDIAPLEREE